MRARLIFFVLIISAFNQINAAEISCTETDKKGIENSIKNYLNSTKNSALKYKDVTLLSKSCVKGYAKVIVHPKKPITDDATVYLQQDKSNWRVLSLGTFFEPDFLAKIPKELR
jgi:ABC-type enterochelin transport system substrate-binding protein